MHMCVSLSVGQTSLSIEITGQRVCGMLNKLEAEEAEMVSAEIHFVLAWRRSLGLPNCGDAGI